MQINDEPTTQIFDVVEIEVNKRCNRACSYCPNSQSGYASREARMEAQLFSKICIELAELRFAGRISFHFYNEPLLRKDLATLVSEIRAMVPMAFIDIYTNGDLLTEKKYAELIAAGADRFYITRHSFDDFQNRDYQVVQMPSAMTLSGRGGMIETTLEPLDLPCFAPSEMLSVRHDGTVVLCCEDAEQSQILGNARFQSLVEIWNDKRFDTLRKLLQKGDRASAGGICAGCTNRAHPLPGTAI